ncbi:hypothetical protein R80B4_00901 [Fibrobacteres bacterium R8-0-B4]
MSDSELAELAVLRLNKAARCLQSAERALAAGDFEDAANRSYYCIFHSMKAVLALDGFNAKSHGEIIGKFRKDYIKTGFFHTKYSDIIGDAEDVRIYCDYDDSYIVSVNGVSALVENAMVFFCGREEVYRRENPSALTPCHAPTTPSAVCGCGRSAVWDRWSGRSVRYRLIHRAINFLNFICCLPTAIIIFDRNHLNNKEA